MGPGVGKREVSVKALSPGGSLGHPHTLPRAYPNVWPYTHRRPFEGLLLADETTVSHCLVSMRHKASSSLPGV